ncbi:MAG: hypothetical protein QME81_16010 [bacterium]|nr:hypothetical protein [bacterium]
MIELSGPQKAALLIRTLGEEIVEKVFSYLEEEEIERLTLELTHLPDVNEEERVGVLTEFQEDMIGQEFISNGGVEYAYEALAHTFGADRAARTISRLTAASRLMQESSYHFLKDMDLTPYFYDGQGKRE